MSAKGKRLYAERKARGICTKCGKRPCLPMAGMCHACNGKHLAVLRRQREKVQQAEGTFRKEVDLRVVAVVLRACSLPPLSRDQRFDDTLPERSSPDGFYVDYTEPEYADDDNIEPWE